LNNIDKETEELGENLGPVPLDIGPEEQGLMEGKQSEEIWARNVDQ
jgi:hypothetical protein